MRFLLYIGGNIRVLTKELNICNAIDDAWSSRQPITTRDSGLSGLVRTAREKR